MALLQGNKRVIFVFDTKYYGIFCRVQFCLIPCILFKVQEWIISPFNTVAKYPLFLCDYN